MKPILMSSIVVAVLSSGVQLSAAADLPPRQPAAMVMPAPVFNWTGCYVGANLGGAWGNIEVTDVSTGATSSHTNSGFAGGGQIGCDYQWNAWVFGIRDMFDGTSLSGSRTFSDALISGSVDSHTHWFDTLTARGGYLVQPNILLYVQGGAAWSQTDLTFFNSAGTQIGQLSNNGRTGWTAGGGVEWMFVPHWSAFLEYDFMGFGTRSSAFTACGAATCAVFSAKADVQDVLVGVNYRF